MPYDIILDLIQKRNNALTSLSHELLLDPMPTVHVKLHPTRGYLTHTVGQSEL